MVTVVGDGFRHCAKPCAECPWRRDSPVKRFPAQAYRISAPTSYDMATEMFSCHMAGKKDPAVCAGFLLRARHNMSVRIKLMRGEISLQQIADIDLYDDYREMAVANGVKPGEAVLRKCR